MSIKWSFFLFYRHERLIDIKWVDFFSRRGIARSVFKNIALDFLIQRLVCEILNFEVKTFIKIERPPLKARLLV